MGKAMNNIWSVLLLALVLMLASCTGSTEIPTPDLDSPAVEQPSGPFVGLPAIPIDGAMPDKASSANNDPGGGDDGTIPPEPPPWPMSYTVFGSDYLIMEGGIVAGTSLVLGVGEGEDGGLQMSDSERSLCYGLYKIGGLQGAHPVSLNIECVPQFFGDGYFVGVANYTNLHWDWFGPVKFPEFQLDLSETGNQYVTHLGNLYFILVCMDGNIVRHDQSTVVTGPPLPPPLPGTPLGLTASDGEFEFEVHLNWLPSAGAEYYEIWRQDLFFIPPGGGGGTGGDPSGGNGDGSTGDPGIPPDPELGWYLVGISPEPFYIDPVYSDAHFLYKVRAGNQVGFSGWSNIDEGWAFGVAPPPGEYVIDGVVLEQLSPMGPASPLPGVEMFLTGFPPDIPVYTDENGYFRFEGVPLGLHMLAPKSTTHLFDPPYMAIDIPSPDGTSTVTVTFTGMPNPDAARRVWGFVAQADYSLGILPMYLPLADVEVWANHTQLGLSFGGTSDANGYYGFVIGADGDYNVSAYLEGYTFEPQQHFVQIGGDPVGGNTLLGPVNFTGFPEVQPQ